jgi:hypothetical protein
MVCVRLPKDACMYNIFIYIYIAHIEDVCMTFYMYAQICTGTYVHHVTMCFFIACSVIVASHSTNGGWMYSRTALASAGILKLVAEELGQAAT